MRKSPLTREEVAELARLWEQYKAALDLTMKAVAADGVDSPAYLEAHKAGGEAYRKIQEILGATGQHWVE
jgi:hypothetical protein